MGWNPLSQTVKVFQDIKANPRYYWMAASACWGGMLFGWDSGLLGGVLPRPAFKKAFGLSEDPVAYANHSGWVAVTLHAGCFFGAMSAAFFAERFGRRGGLFIAAFFFHLGSLLQTTCKLGSQSAHTALGQLYLGRAIGGVGVGLVSVTVPTYVSESSPKHIRGRLTGMYQLFIVTGIAISFWINYGLLLDIGDANPSSKIWRIPFALQHIPGILLVVTMYFEKESPRWLGEKGRWDEARAVIARLSQKPEDHPDVVNEADEIRHDLEKNVRLSFSEQFRQATSSGKMFYRCSLPAILMFWQQMTGVNSMNYYSPIIFNELGMKGSAPGLLGTGIYGIVKIVMTLLVLSLGMEQYGRKALLVWGGLGQALPMFYIAGYRNIRQNDPNNIDGASYVAILMIYLYVTFYSFGWSVAPWPAMSESVPNQLRSLTMAVGLMSNWAFNFMITKITPILLVKIKWGTYLLFGCTTLGAALWAVFFLPETGGYAIEDIHQLYSGNIIAQSLRDNKYLFKMYDNKAQGAVDSSHLPHHHTEDKIEHDSTSKGSEEQIEKSRIQ